MMRICKESTIQAAHFLPNTPTDHKCHGMHGHTWTVRAWYSGPIDPSLGWIVDYSELDRIWRKGVFSVLDHTVINATIPNPTTELLAGWIYARLAQQMESDPVFVGVSIVRIDVCEGGGNWTILEIEQPARGGV